MAFGISEVLFWFAVLAAMAIFGNGWLRKMAKTWFGAKHTIEQAKAEVEKEINAAKESTKVDSHA